MNKALLVGINYKGSKYELNGCINDVNHIKEVLINYYQYLPENIKILTDETTIKPTRNNILSSWQWLLSDLAGTGNLYFHYSGHGSNILDMDGDEKDGKDETICPLDFMTSGMIIDDLIRTELANKVPITHKLVAVFDSCHSETICDLAWTCNKNYYGHYVPVKTDNYPDTKANVIVISGCRDNQYSSDAYINNIYQGALTYCLIDVLKMSNYRLTWEQLLSKIIQKISIQRISSQIPCMTLGKFYTINAIVKL